MPFSIETCGGYATRFDQCLPLAPPLHIQYSLPNHIGRCCIYETPSTPEFCYISEACISRKGGADAKPLPSHCIDTSMWYLSTKFPTT